MPGGWSEGTSFFTYGPPGRNVIATKMFGVAGWLILLVFLRFEIVMKGPAFCLISPLN